jgi:histidinol-phosphate aminotransferase
VLAAIAKALNEDLRKYPDPMATAVRRKAAEVFGTRPERVLGGNGSDELLTIITRCFAGEGDKIVFPYPSYSLYKTLAEIQGARACPFQFSQDYSLPREIAQPDAKVTFIANPNSPSGTFIRKTELRRLAGRVSGVLVLDEAYVDFAEENCLDLVEKFPNVIVLRTFSKSFSLAGMRIGFAFAQEPLIEGLVKAKDSYNVNRLWIAAALAALGDLDYVRKNIETIKKDREHLISQLRRMGLFVYPSQANFVMARFSSPEMARSIYERLKAQKILIRHWAQPRIEDCVRITVGTRDEIDALLKALRPLLGSESQRKKVSVQ